MKNKLTSLIIFSLLIFPISALAFVPCDVCVDDSAYNATTWNGNDCVPTMDAVRDKIETVSAAAAPVGAKYIVQTADGTLSAEQALGALASGIVYNTTTTGALSIATQGTDYYKPGGTDVADVDVVDALTISGGTIDGTPIGGTTSAIAQTRVKRLYPAILSDTTSPHQLTIQECSNTLITTQGWNGTDDIQFGLPDISAYDGSEGVLVVRFKDTIGMQDADTDFYIDPDASTQIDLDGTLTGTDGDRIWYDNITIRTSIVCSSDYSVVLGGFWSCYQIVGVAADKGS